MWKVFMHRNFSFPLLHCYSAMDVLQMQMQHCNKCQDHQDLSLPSGSDILPIYWSCRASAIYDLPINLRYIHKRVPALVVMRWSHLTKWLKKNTFACPLVDFKVIFPSLFGVFGGWISIIGSAIFCTPQIWKPTHISLFLEGTKKWHFLSMEI